jgi:hypothetical protein
MRNFFSVAAIAAAVAFSAPSYAQLADELGASGPGAGARGGGPPICTDPDMVTIDDGAAENGYSANAAVVNEATFVQLFDTVDFPQGTIDTICLGWVSLGPTSANFEIVVYDDDGPGGNPGTELSATPHTISGLPTGLPEITAAYDMTSAAITLPASGNFYLGVRFTPTDPNFFIAADETDATNAGAGQVFYDTGDPMTDDWQAVNVLFPNYSALIVRALPGLSAPPPPTAQAVPSVSNFGLLLMALVLAGIAVVVIRTR